MAKLLLYGLALILIFSMGPILIFHGKGTRIGLPWALFQVPILNNAGSARFMIYAWLDFAIITALWLSDRHISQSIRVTIGALTIVSLLPNLSAGFWLSPSENVPFFSSGVFKHYLSKDETVLILPYGTRGEPMYWQAQTHMYFRWRRVLRTRPEISMYGRLCPASKRRPLCPTPRPSSERSLRAGE